MMMIPLMLSKIPIPLEILDFLDHLWRWCAAWSASKSITTGHVRCNGRITCSEDGAQIELVCAFWTRS